MYLDLREQLVGSVETLEKLQGWVDVLKARLVHYVDQGEGLTQNELVRAYAEIDRLFPCRVRRSPEGVDDLSV